MAKVLFILKCRDLPYTGEEQFFKNKKRYSECMTSGLLNSATLVSNMLIRHGIESKVVQVIDNNDIDREVTKFRPTHVMIEALWVVPEKFQVLRKLHPNVKWIIRLHSETPFLANEGIAIRWLNRYIDQENVYLAPNSKRLYDDLIHYYKAIYEDAHDKIVYLPNFYDEPPEIEIFHDKSELNIASFGAIRPMKNQLIQAMAAIEYARNTNKRLKFHINSQRIEQSGNPVLENIRSLFKELDINKYELIEHPWMKHSDFRRLVRKMDLGLQVSFSETHNIVTADFVSQNIPVVVSDEISWVSRLFHAETGDSKDIVHKMHRALMFKCFGKFLNRYGLDKYNRHSVKNWMKYLNRGNKHWFRRS